MTLQTISAFLRLEDLGIVAMSLLTSLGAAGSIYGLWTSPRLRSFVSDYTTRTRKKYESIHQRTRAAGVLRAQVFLFFIITLFAFATSPLLLFLLPLCLWLPTLDYRTREKEYVTKIESQLDAWLVALANALRAGPSLGDAITSTIAITPAPFRHELEYLSKEQSLGTPLGQALENLSQRCRSHTVRSALVMLRVAQRSGGRLPDTLEQSAAGLREMARLEGVVRTKTAEGKTQSYVLGATPFLVLVVLQVVNPDLLAPLFDTSLGHLLIAVALMLWVGAIVLAQRILDVDI